MKAALRIAAGYRHYVSGIAHLIDGVECEIDPGATVSDLLDAAGFPPNVTMIVFVNGGLANKDTFLKDGDEVFLAQPTVGG